MVTSMSSVSTWVPSLVLAGMLGLFQGRNARVPRRFLTQVRLVASCVLCTSAYLLYRDKESDFSPRKLNALMVFGFVLHHYFMSNGLEARPSRPSGPPRIPVGNALYKMPAYDGHRVLRPRSRTKRTAAVPEGWDVQFDGGAVLRGKKQPRKEQQKYVAEKLGEWHSAEESFVENVVEPVKPHQPVQAFQERVSSGNYPANSLRNLGKISLRNNLPAKVANAAGDETQERGKRPIEEVQKNTRSRHVAVVEDLTRKEGPELFNINPIEHHQAKCATANQDMEARAKFKQHPTSFTIIPRTIPGVTSVLESSFHSEKSRSAEAKEPVSKPVTANLSLRNRNVSSARRLKERIRRRADSRTANAYGTPPPASKPQPAPRPRRERVRSFETDDLIDGTRGIRHGSRRRARKWREKVMSRSLEDIRVPSVDRMDAPRHSRDARPVSGNRIAPARPPRYIRKKPVAKFDPWADSFDNTDLPGSLKTKIRRNTMDSAVNFAYTWRNMLLLALIVLSHVGFYMMMQKYKTGVAPKMPPRQHVVIPKFLAVDDGVPGSATNVFVDEGWGSGKSQQLFTVPNPEAETLATSLDGGKHFGFLEEPLLTGFVEAFLLFCVVKGTMECVDNYFSS